MEMCMVGNEKPHERELGLIERVELVGSESAERSEWVERAAQEDIMQAIFFEGLTGGSLVRVKNMQ
jgi:hypothetical protein